MDDIFVGTVLLFAGKFAPVNWAFCDGTILPVAQNMALFSLIGATYGGNGTTTFALPDLRSRVPMGATTAATVPGLTPRAPGAQGGAEKVTLLASQLPSHTHSQLFANAAATSDTPTGNVIAQPTGKVASSGDDLSLLTYGPATPADLVSGSAAGIGMTGGGQPFEILPPFLGMNYIICTNGLYPEHP